jgi:hypothetical protein
MSDDFEAALQAIAKVRGISLVELKKEMLEKAMGLGGAEAPRPPRRELARVSSGDASGATRSRSEAIQAHRAQEFPGSPVVRYRDEEETPEEAQERWYEEEAELMDGVHGLGGSTAGGIFGDAAISTNIYDPGAMARGDSRIGQQANIKLLGLVERLERHLDASEAPRGELPPGSRHQTLPGGRTRRLGAGNK